MNTHAQPVFSLETNHYREVSASRLLIFLGEPPHLASALTVSQAKTDPAISLHTKDMCTQCLSNSTHTHTNNCMYLGDLSLIIVKNCSTKCRRYLMSLTHTPTPNASGSPSCCNNQNTPLGFAVSPKVFVSSQNENHSWLCWVFALTLRCSCSQPCGDFETPDGWVPPLEILINWSKLHLRHQEFKKSPADSNG